MAAVTVSSFQSWRERRQARQGHEQLTNSDDDEDPQNESHPLQVDSGSDEGLAIPGNNVESADLPSPSATTPMIDTVADIETGMVQADDDARPTETTATVVLAPTTRASRRAFTLADLQEEREMGRRRTSFCVLFAVFILFRLWIQAVATGDFFLLVLCLMGTSWTARFIRHTREREEELDRMIAGYHDGESGANAERIDLDLQRMSFQAQLAMAIINSQRDMMQGGFGNPDGYSSASGVSDEAKERWDRFQFNPNRKGYGSLSLGESLEKASKAPDSKEEDGPHCSICLGEYEEGENLVCLPCKHVYHDDCVSSWCTSHIRCPLCNFDLESVTSDTATMTTASSL